MASATFPIQPSGGAVLATVPEAFGMKKCNFDHITEKYHLKDWMRGIYSGKVEQLHLESSRKPSVPKSSDVVFMKVFPPPTDENGDPILAGSLVELFIYYRLLKPIYETSSNHFTQVYDAYWCDDDPEITLRKIIKNEELAENIVKSLTLQSSRKYDETKTERDRKTITTYTETITQTKINKLWLLSLKKEQNVISFDRFLIKLRKDQEEDDRVSKFKELMKVIFQVLYACEVLNVLGIRHNELLLHNISIIEMDEEVTTTYDIRGKMYTIKSKWRPIILDFEKATIHTTSIQKKYRVDNPNVDNSFALPVLFGDMSQPNIRFDTFTFLVSLYDKLISFSQNDPIIGSWFSTFNDRVIAKSMHNSVLLNFYQNKKIKLVDRTVFGKNWMLHTDKIIELISKDVSENYKVGNILTLPTEAIVDNKKIV